MGLNKPFFKVLAALLLLFVLFIHLTVEILGFLLFWSGRICTWVFARFFTVLVKVAGILLWPLAASFDRIFQTLARAYPPTLRTLLTNRAAIVVVAAIVLSLLYGSFNTARELGQEILPEVHQGELIAHLGLHVGAPVEQTNRVVARAEKETMKVKEIEWVSSTIGIARDEISSAEEGEHTAKIYIKIEGESGDLRSREERVLAQLRDIYASFPEILTCRFTRPTIFSVKSPVQVEIKGIRLDEIHEAARLVEERMHQIPGLEDVKSSVQRGSPEVRIRFNREKLARYSLDTATLASLISESVKGMVPTRFMSSEHKIDILVRVNQDDIACVKDLKDLVINPQSDAPIPLSAVADIRIVEGPSEIRRIWGQRAAIVSANLSQFDMGGTAQRISATISPIEEEGNLTLNIGGQGKELESAMDNMYLALCLAIFLVYIVMASQFESLYQPFIIICSIPLAFIGVVYILYWLKINISVVVFIGGIMLAGIVVNNAIVLVDYINQLRRRGMEKTDAIIAACRIRLRPILMTTATTVLGLLPLTGALGMLAGPGSALHLGLGEGMEIRAPMAITVIAGLISSTLLTLFIIPLVYSLTDRVFSRLGAALKRG